MKTFYLYWHNNPTPEKLRGASVQEAVKLAGLTNTRLNNMLTAWSEGDEPNMRWDSSDCGGWVGK